MRWLLVVLVACAHATSVPTAEVAPNSAEILARMAATYAGASTYADRGEVVEKRTRSGKTQVTRLVFQTAFRRAGGFRFEATEDGRRDHGYLIWSGDNKEAVTRWSGTPGVAEKEPFAFALGSISVPADMVSNVFSAFVAESRLGIDSYPHRLPSAQGSTFEVLHGHPCVRVVFAEHGASMELWIDRETYLIRQERIRRPEGAGRDAVDLDTLITLEPAANTPIADAQLAPPDLAGVKITVRERAAWIGILMQQGGNRVTNVFEHSPAADAGIQVGDFIAAVEDHEITGLAQLRAEVRRFPIGTHVPFEIHRNGEKLVLQVEIAVRPDLDDLARQQLLNHPAPDFALTALDGTSVSLVAQRGHAVVLDFWATWCQPCAITAPMLADVHAKHPDVTMLGISDEDEATIRAHIAAHPSAYEIVRDADAKVSRAYLVSGIPMVILIDQAGIVRFVGMGIDGAAELEKELAKLP